MVKSKSNRSFLISTIQILTIWIVVFLFVTDCSKNSSSHRIPMDTLLQKVTSKLVSTRDAIFVYDSQTILRFHRESGTFEQFDPSDLHTKLLKRYIEFDRIEMDIKAMESNSQSMVEFGAHPVNISNAASQSDSVHFALSFLTPLGINDSLWAFRNIAIASLAQSDPLSSLSNLKLVPFYSILNNTDITTNPSLGFEIDEDTLWYAFTTQRYNSSAERFGLPIHTGKLSYKKGMISFSDELSEINLNRQIPDSILSIPLLESAVFRQWTNQKLHILSKFEYSRYLGSSDEKSDFEKKLIKNDIPTEFDRTIENITKGKEIVAMSLFENELSLLVYDDGFFLELHPIQERNVANTDSNN